MSVRLSSPWAVWLTCRFVFVQSVPCLCGNAGREQQTGFYAGGDVHGVDNWRLGGSGLVWFPFLDTCGPGLLYFFLISIQVGWWNTSHKHDKPPTATPRLGLLGRKVFFLRGRVVDASGSRWWLARCLGLQQQPHRAQRNGRIGLMDQRILTKTVGLDPYSLLIEFLTVVCIICPAFQ